eukprot:4149129-Prymnesium_polylepis.1
MRALWKSRAAVVLLNFANWCRGPNGRLHTTTKGHDRCQAMLFNRSTARANLRAALVPDPYDHLILRLATYYGHAAVSVFGALQPLVVNGALDAVDFTHDGKHPVYWPTGTERGAIYATFVADMLAHAISPSLLSPGKGLWTGRYWRKVLPLSRALDDATADMPSARWRRTAFGR